MTEEIEVVNLSDIDPTSLVCSNRSGFLKRRSDCKNPMYVLLPELDMTINSGYLSFNVVGMAKLVNINLLFDCRDLNDEFSCDTDWFINQSVPVYDITNVDDIKFTLSTSENNIFEVERTIRIKAQLCVQFMIDDSTLMSTTRCVVITKNYDNDPFMNDISNSNDELLNEFFRSNLVSDEMKGRVNKHHKLELPQIII